MTRTRTDGFSLIELMIVAGLIAVLAGISVPMIAAGMTRYSLISASQQVVSTIRAARYQAVGKNMRLRVRFNYPADGQYQILRADDDSAVGDIQFLPDGAAFGDVSDDIQIDTSGRVTGVVDVPPVTIVVTNDDAQIRTITVSASGRVQLP
ncbi:MAG: prepilin-type N-terminal cleavage/methylation domain-containing protein [Acidobacteria bacterium]|nr:prepilin-type N-terminal cleavage/methylation domain-containing protein [Acidobacteriota bacterium]